MLEEKEQTMKNTETVGTESLVEDTVAKMKGIPTEQQLIEILKKQTMKVTFQKLDGEQRIMTCTKSFDSIPESLRPKTNKPPKAGTVTVWDLNAQAWRSFRYDRVQAVEEFTPPKEVDSSE